ncbi:MAG: TIGR03663 family protein [Dehalococcoidia bacterium]|nr:TIGR03663 family protein [Dehalococcoidia bacterium]
MTAPSIPVRYQARSFDRLLGIQLSINAELAIYAVLLAAAALLRIWDLGAGALHHDESIHAKFSWDLVRGNYTHDPVFHGPLYYHAQGLVFFLFGASDYTARLSAALFGIALATLPLLLRRRLGLVGTVAAVSFIAFSPTIVYYSRFFREDIYMATFTMLSFVAIWRYFDGGRDRWLVVFALAVAGSFATKEATYLSVAIMLVFLDVHLSTILAAQTLEDRGTNTTLRRTMLTIAIAPYAWAIVALWPFLGSLRRSAAWTQIPRSGDLLIILGTLTVPVMAPFLKPLLESAGFVAEGRLDHPFVYSQANPDAAQNRMILAGIYLVLVGAVAFIGLQWRWKTWLIAFGSASFAYLTLFTSFWTNFDGLGTGPWGSLDYWLSQQDVFRGDQPWFYYYLLMPAYEFLPLVIAIGGAFWAVARGDAFSRYLVFWLVATWLGLSWAGEKMPWLNTHIALPTCILAAWTAQRAWTTWSPERIDRLALLRLLSAAVVGLGAMLAIAYLPGGTTYLAIRFLFAAGAAGAVGYVASSYGRPAIATFAVVAVVGALGFFSLRTMIQASFITGDVPEDMLIYTQSSPYIPPIAEDIDRLAAATGKGYDMPIAVDSRDSMSWPWAWYLRDYKTVNYSDFSQNVPDPAQFDVILVNQADIATFQDSLSASAAAEKFAPPEKYPHRWWFDERYKAAMATPGVGSCTASGGECGPFQPQVKIGGHLRLGVPNWDTWGRIWDGVTGGWIPEWATYIRDHRRPGSGEFDRCRSCGSINAFAYFPATFDRATGLITARPLEPSQPGTDDSGRAVFGGLGSLPGQFFSPVDIESDADGNLYVIDTASKKLQKFDSTGNFIAAVDVRTNEGGNFPDSEPWGLGVAPDGRIVVADTFGWRVRVFNPDLTPTNVAFGNPHSGADPGEFDLFGPRDVVVDARDRMWVTDTGHDRVVVYTMDGEFVMSIGTSGSGPGQFDEPVGLAIDSTGVVYVADMYNARVVRLSPDGEFLGSFDVPGWGGQDVSDKPYLAMLSGDRLAASVPQGALVRIFSSEGDPLGTIGPDDDPLSQPYGLTESADGKLWIVEGGNARVRLFDIP